MGLSGLEPPTLRLSGARSNQLSYKPWLYSFKHHLWQISLSVETKRFELSTPCLQGRCSPNWAKPPWRLAASRSLYRSLDLTGISLFLLSLIRQHPVLPYRYQYSTFGRSRLNHRVRDGNGCVPWAHNHRKTSVVFHLLPTWTSSSAGTRKWISKRFIFL